MRIGELATKAGTTTRALRYYESQGLLTSRRMSNGYREYDEGDLRVVDEIRSLLDLGFSLEDTRPFVECLRAGNESGDVCPNSVAVYRRRIEELDECMGRLGEVRRRLEVQLHEATARARTIGATSSSMPYDKKNCEGHHSDRVCERC